MKRTAPWALAAGILVTVVTLLLAGPHVRDRRTSPGTVPLDATPVGTSGHMEDSPDPYATAAILHDLETMTGAVDEHELIGRRVDFHEKVVGVGASGAFWIGTGDNRELVVAGRDTRTGDRGDGGDASTTAVMPVAGGQMVHVTGTIEPVPYAETRSSWRVSDTRHGALDDVKVYIRADSVTPDS